ncbi:polyphenol oxidase family protein [Nocardioides sp.]|uniref:polyphenol oxidase family protein n=1 Tax=Nocardioides sp. TaxID=35761 RepID=UPI0035132C39
MFSFRESFLLDPDAPAASRVEVAFTDASIDLQGSREGFASALHELEVVAGVPFARLNQVHGADVHRVEVVPTVGVADDVPTADAQVTTLRGVGLMVRVADCVPVVLAARGAGDGEAVLGVAHAGRRGVALDVVTRTVEAMRDLGARGLRAWVGPHVCGRCYEVPAAMQREVVDLVPATRATTRAGTAALDLGAGVLAQLAAADVEAVAVGPCTLEDAGLHSYRRDGSAAGRFAGLVWAA